MDVAYLRYQDDILILCQTKRQLGRCKQRLMAILDERRLRLSTKKTRIGTIDKGFHFLGINYLKPQSSDGTNVSQNKFDTANQKQSEQNNTSMEGGEQLNTSWSYKFSAHNHRSTCANDTKCTRAS